jgi:hypothetical protein
MVIGGKRYDVNHQSERMMVSHNFLFIAGEPALDFVNTEIVRDGERVDLLNGPEALEAWIREASLGRVRVTPAALKDAKRLRAALRKFAAGEASPLRVINQELQRGPGALALRAKDGKFELTFEPRDEDRDSSSPVPRQLLATADPSRIRACEGATASSTSTTRPERHAPLVLHGGVRQSHEGGGALRAHEGRKDVMWSAEATPPLSSARRGVRRNGLAARIRKRRRGGPSQNCGTSQTSVPSPRACGGWGVGRGLG